MMIMERASRCQVRWLFAPLLLVGCSGGPFPTDGTDAVRDNGPDNGGEAPDVCRPRCWLTEPDRVRVCGDNDCGGSCGECPAGRSCLQGYWCRESVGCDGRCDEQVLIPAGPFLQGCDPERYAGGTTRCVGGSATPLHEVDLPAYRIDRFEVTNERYRRCLDAGACPPPFAECLPSHGLDMGYLTQPEYSEFPVFCVGWDAADTFCRWEGHRLPTEAEWEKAARGGCELRGDRAVCEPVDDAPTFVWGEDEFVVGPGPTGCYPPDGTCEINIDNPMTYMPGPVGSFPLDVSPYGVHDLAGNVTEWVFDWYDASAYGACGAPCLDPSGPPEGVSKVLRGSGFYLLAMADTEAWTTFGRQYSGWPAAGILDEGFRCAADAE